MEFSTNMTVRSNEKDVLDVGANPTISTKRYKYTQREWDREVGWGVVPTERSMGMKSFDKASSIQADSPKDD